MYKKINLQKYTLFLLILLLFTIKATYSVEELELKKPSWLNKAPKTILKGNVTESITKIKPQTGIGVIGLRFIHQNGYPTYVDEVYPNSPAYKGGIRKSDLISAIDGVKTNRLNPDGVYQLLSGKPGTKVTVSISRGKTIHNIPLIREDLANFTPNVQNRYLLGPIAVPFDFKEHIPYN